MWDCKIPQSHNSTMAQSYNGPMLQSHNDSTNVEPFQVTVESRSSATLRGLPICPRRLIIVGLCDCEIVALWDCKIPQFHNSTMAQSYSGSMLQSHNDGANVEPFQVTLESRSRAGTGCSRNARDSRSASDSRTAGASSGASERRGPAGRWGRHSFHIKINHFLSCF